MSSSEPELVQVGGQVDTSCVTFGVYGENLDPEEVSKLLSCAPTHSHRRGDLISGTSNPRPFGAWLLTFQVTAPQGPNELVAMLQEQLPSNLELWRSLRSSYEIRVTFGIFLDDWNRNFQFTPEELRFLSSLGAAIGFDVYSHREEGDG